MLQEMTMVLIRLFTIFILILLVSACENRVGVEWVTDYSAVGKHNVYNRDDNAQGFYNIIKAHPEWDGMFDVGNTDAWEKHFKRPALGGLDDDWIDNVDFAYFSGHGAGEGTVYGSTGVGRGGGFTFGVNANDDWVLASIPSLQEPQWGDDRLEWIVLDVCSALAKLSDGDGVEHTLDDRWRNADVMHGLHFILGFRTAATDSGTRGQIFADYLTGARDGINHTVRTAWRKATEDTEGPYYPTEGAYLRAHSSGSNTLDDHIYEYGAVSSDPDPATQSYGYSSWITW
jgi:hypothetical protein